MIPPSLQSARPSGRIHIKRNLEQNQNTKATTKRRRKRRERGGENHKGYV